MGDLPPSYEAATGIPVAQRNFNNEPLKPSAPSSGPCDATPYTTAIQIQPETILSPQHLQQPPSSYPTSMPTPQTNVVVIRDQSRKRSKTSLWLTLALIVFLMIGGLIVALIAIHSSKPKYKPDFTDTSFGSIYAQTEYPKIDWDSIIKSNQEQLERIHSKIYEMPKFDYNI